MTVRIVLLAVIGCALLPAMLKGAPFLAAELAGLALGIALGTWGAQRTRFLTLDGRMYYVPHTYTGLAVSLLFLGRLLYRGLKAYTVAHGEPGAADAAPAFTSPPAMFPTGSLTPLTLGIFFVLIGYYVYFYCWVLWKAKHLDSADLETVAPAAGK